jgi:hypothetical protein
MTNAQLYLAIGMPTLAVLVGILINGLQFHAQIGALSGRLAAESSSLSARLTTVGTSLNARMASLETRMMNLETKFDLLMGKVIDIDNRLTRFER